MKVCQGAYYQILHLEVFEVESCFSPFSMLSITKWALYSIFLVGSVQSVLHKSNNHLSQISKQVLFSIQGYSSLSKLVYLV